MVALLACPLFASSQVDTSQLFSVSGQVISAYDGLQIPFGNILYGRTSGTQVDSSGNFSINNLKSGQYRFRFSAMGYPNADTTITIQGADIVNIKWTIRVACPEIGRDSALRDIEAMHLKLLLQSGDPPFIYSNDRKFSKKYKISFYEFGCVVMYPFDCLKEYNGTIFSYLDKKYGKKWRRHIRPDVLGYK